MIVPLIISSAISLITSLIINVWALFKELTGVAQGVKGGLGPSKGEEYREKTSGEIQKISERGNKLQRKDGGWGKKMLIKKRKVQVEEKREKKRHKRAAMEHLGS